MGSDIDATATLASMKNPVPLPLLSPYPTAMARTDMEYSIAGSDESEEESEEESEDSEDNSHESEKEVNSGWVEEIESL
jgi:hypothetical protein